MTSKFAIKSILAGSSVLMLSVISTPVWAPLYPQSTSQTTCTLAMRAAKLCSVKTEGLLRGLGNVQNDETFYRVFLNIKAGHVVFQNPAGKSSQAQGVAFANVGVVLTGTEQIAANQIDQNGRALGDVTFHDDALVNAILLALESACTNGDQGACDSLKQIGSLSNQKPNWIKWAVLTQLEVLGQQLVEGIVEDALGQACLAPGTVQKDPKSFVGKEFAYDCTQKCRDKTADPSCPNPPSFPL